MFKNLKKEKKTKAPVDPWDFPNHCCWGPQKTNFI